MKHFFLVLALLITALAQSAEKLNIEFKEPVTLDIAGKQYKIDGQFTEGKGFAIGGSHAFSVPGSSLIGENCGSLFFSFSIGEMQPPLNIQRPLLTLRTGSRKSIGFNYYKDKSLQFSFAELTQGILFAFPEKLVVGKVYDLGCTWDGNVVRLYYGGKMIAEKVQPFPLPRNFVRNLSLGPYKDGWFAPRTWANDTFVRNLKVYDEALLPAAVAEMYQVKFTPLEQTHPQVLDIPKVPAGMQAPKNDGKLNEEAWKYAASMPRLVDITFPEKSGSIPPHDFKLLYDDSNIYLGLSSVFPTGANIQEGTLRTPTQEPAAWTDECFEFYVRIGDVTYHFIGNVAGGYMERRNRNADWNGKWSYTSTKEMKIDSSTLWQGEVAIPWNTLELSGPPKEAIQINFCRSWKLPECGAFSSLLLADVYAPKTQMVLARFTNAPTLQVLEQNDANTGSYTHKYKIASAQGGVADYDVSLARRDGSAVPMSVFKCSYTLKKGEIIQDEQTINIGTAGYDCMVYTLKGKNGIAMREIVPFKLNENFFAVEPFFLEGEILVNLQIQTMRRKFGADFQGKLHMLAPNGDSLATADATQPVIKLPFDKSKAATGIYKVELRNAANEKVDAIELNYPGLGEWARQDFHPERIVPPFTPMSYVLDKDAMGAWVACRNYVWKKSFLPTQISANDEELFATEPQIVLGNKVLVPERFETKMAEKHRAEFETASTALKIKSWLEYDGVQWNEMELAPGKGSLDIKFTFPASIAKYLHATYCHGWGSKITRLLPEGKLNLDWLPIVWIGNEEKGFCFFAEERNDWNSPSKQTYTIEKNGDKVTLTVHIWSKLENAKKRSASFGLLATPVKKIKNAPFDTFNFDYVAPLNRPGRRPTAEIIFIKSMSGGDLGNFFGDMDNPYAAIVRRNHKMMLDKLVSQPKLRPMAYTGAKFLSVKYPEVAAYLPSWKMKPEFSMDYEHTSHFVYECCPTTMASDFFVWKVKDMLKRNPAMKGVYFDFGTVSECSNTAHGCHNRYPLLAFREYYRRVAIAQLEAGIEIPAVCIHNTDYVMVPCYTFVTNLFNGEQLRQESSTTFHNGKDIIDTMPLALFATELSSIPFGITNSVYLPFDKLNPKYGGTEEDTPYKFRMGKAAFAMTLPHNTLPGETRNHFGLFDKLIRIYDDFGVEQAKFVGYWHNFAKVSGGSNILVSCYALPSQNKVLAIIGHAGKEHKNQDFSIMFDWKALGLAKSPKNAVDKMTAPDPDYEWLFKQSEKYRISKTRAPIELGDFGSKVLGFDGNTLKMHLDFHCFAIVELQ